MSIATFESPQVASQQFFPWVFDEDSDCGYADSEPVQDFVAEVDCSPAIPVFVQNSLLCASQSNKQTASTATSAAPSVTTGAARLGTPVRLGAVMLKLLKSYGITDEEIAEGMAAYAAKAGLAHAG